MPIKKSVFTVNVDGYSPQITAITYPLIEYYAEKIGAEFVVIDERKYPDKPPVYEKLQIHELGKNNDWNIYIDSDTLVHPDMFDVTEHLHKDTVLHNGVDMAGNRWKYDRYFRRDGRHIGSCNWFTIASDWCIDLWEPLTDLTYSQALDNIYPTVGELNTVVTREHLIDDYVLSRNIAKYGLKLVSLIDLLTKMGRQGESYFWHEYTISAEGKAIAMKEVLRKWNMLDADDNPRKYKR